MKKRILNEVLKAIDERVKESQKNLANKFYVLKKITKEEFDKKLKEIEINYISLKILVYTDYKEMSNEEFINTYNLVGIKSLIECF